MSTSLYQFKRDEQNMNDGNLADVTTAGSSSFKKKLRKYFTKSKRYWSTKKYKNSCSTKIFFILEMPLINYKIHLELKWSKNCLMSTTAKTTFKITSAKLCVPIVTLSTKDNVNLTKHLNEGFKRSVY